MNPNGTIAAKVAPKMMNDIVPPYAGTLPSFAQPQPAAPDPQAAIIQAQPIQIQPEPLVAQAPAAEPVAAVTSTPMFNQTPAVPATVVAGSSSPMFSSSAQPAPAIMADPASAPAVSVPTPMADANLTAPVIAQPIAPAGHAPKQKTNWLAIMFSVMVAAALGVVAYLVFKQNH